jgi:hypothetical protein
MQQTTRAKEFDALVGHWTHAKAMRHTHVARVQKNSFFGITALGAQTSKIGATLKTSS